MSSSADRVLNGFNRLTNEDEEEDDLVVMEAVGLAAWAGGWMTRVDERKNASDTARMVSDLRILRMAR